MIVVYTQLQRLLKTALMKPLIDPVITVFYELFELCIHIYSLIEALIRYVKYFNLIVLILVLV